MSLPKLYFTKKQQREAQGRSKKRYYEKNKTEIKKKLRAFYQKNKSYWVMWRNNHKEELKQYMKEYGKKYYKEHKDARNRNKIYISW